jgi:hypothetical protein
VPKEFQSLVYILHFFGSRNDILNEFRFIWLSSLRGEDLKKIGQLETRIVCGDHVC